MPIVTAEPKISAPYYKRMILCPGHWLVPPTVDVYKREPVALLKNCKNFVEVLGKKIRIRKERIVRDRWGRKQVDWKKLYHLRDKGIVLQPRVSAAWAVEHVYDPLSQLCMNCPKYCKEGQGNILTRTIKRLNFGK